jgi:CRP-like cAMP-binding protein
MEDFFETISRLVVLSEESKQALAACLQPIELPKGYMLVKEDTVCNYIYYIEKGLTRTFYYKKGKDITDWISTEKTFALSIISFISRRPDRRGIELLEDSLFRAIHYNDLEKLYQSYHSIERLGRLLISQGLIQVQQRFDELHFTPAQERYKTLLQSHPAILQRVPLAMIASYLGITPETLSRMRAQLSTFPA